MFAEFINNVLHNLFKPLLLFFYLGFLIPILKVPFEFPKPLYKSLVLYLLLAIGWHGGEELAQLSSAQLGEAGGLMVIGFFTNIIIGLCVYKLLCASTQLRRIDAATVAGYYGSDSAGTFVTCIGVLSGLNIAYAAYMPVMLAVMEIPGCLVALLLVSRLRRQGLDAQGNRQGEPGFDADTLTTSSGHGFDTEMLREVFLNPGLYLLFGGIVIGFVGRLQGIEAVLKDDVVFVNLFHGILCLFLLEMGITACERLSDIKQAGWRFVLFALLMPPVLGAVGCVVIHGYGLLLGKPFDVGTYALFACLCAAASYIAVPAVQRLAIPEASPTLPLAASLGLTFTFNVTIGIPTYIQFAKILQSTVVHH